MRKLDLSRAQRLKERCLFSAIDLARFFSHRTPETVKSAKAIFNFIKTSRQDQTAKPDWSAFLTIFVKLCIKYRVPYDDIASLIASSILMVDSSYSSHSKILLDPRVYSY